MGPSWDWSFGEIGAPILISVRRLNLTRKSVIKEMLGHDKIESTKKYLCVQTQLMREVLFDEPL
jgi:hypothetical protein